jgi:hypothetical protein
MILTLEWIARNNYTSLKVLSKLLHVDEGRYTKRFVDRWVENGYLRYRSISKLSEPTIIQITAEGFRMLSVEMSKLKMKGDAFIKTTDPSRIEVNSESVVHSLLIQLVFTHF